MPARRAKKNQKNNRRRHIVLKVILLIVLAVVLIIVASSAIGKIRLSNHQASIAPFYNTDGLSKDGPLGEVVRQEPLGVSVEGGQALRILYRSQRQDGTVSFSSGRLFIPNAPASGERPVVAWAHGTLGMGDQCAPSRALDPVKNFDWVSQMLQNGWVVTASDYSGFGTQGVQGYLVGADEANDVLNSVRAARSLPEAKAGHTYAIWGHSQGGNSALFSASRSSAYAPELRLAGTIASAPAAELIPLLNEQYGTAADWVIGPLVAVAWPAANAELDASQILTPLAQKSYQAIASQCTPQAAIGGLWRNLLRQKFFSQNLAEVPTWRAMAKAQSAPIVEPSQPLLVVESENDQVVLPNTTALYIQTACQAGSNLQTLWLEKASHQQIPAKSADEAINWINARFAGQTNASSCSQPLPVVPATP